MEFYTKNELEEIFNRFSIQRPHPQSDLKYNDSYTLLVAVILSARATDVSVNKVTKTLFSIADTPKKMVNLGEEELGCYIRTIGLWRRKAKNIIALSKILLEKKHEQFPNNLKALMALPGVGRKTANVVLNIAFHEATMAVDTHILRVANRLGLSSANTPERVEENLLRIIPPYYLRYAHQWLVLHGRYVCKARKPECHDCIIGDICKAEIKPASIHSANTIQKFGKR